MGRTPVSSAKFIVSSESVGVPTAEPWMACSPTIDEVPDFREGDFHATGEDEPTFRNRV